MSFYILKKIYKMQVVGLIELLASITIFRCENRKIVFNYAPLSEGLKTVLQIDL